MHKLPFVVAVALLAGLVLLVVSVLFAPEQPRYALAIQLTGPAPDPVAFAQHNPIDVKVPGGETIKIIPVVVEPPVGGIGGITVAGWLSIIAAIGAIAWRIEIVHKLANQNFTTATNKINELQGANKAQAAEIMAMRTSAEKAEKTRVELADTTAAHSTPIVATPAAPQPPLESIKETVEDTNKRVQEMEG